MVFFKTYQVCTGILLSYLCSKISLVSPSKGSVMEHFQPGLSFSPVCRAEISYDYMGVFRRSQPRLIFGGKFKSIARKHKNLNLAPENMKKLVMMVFFQFGILLTLTIQCYGVVIAYQILQAKQLMLLNAYFSTKKNKWARRMKRLKVRRLRRKPRSTWVVKGRTDKWWENIVNGNAPDTVWKKNFRMNKQFFYDLVHKLHPVIGPKPNTPNYRYLTTEKKLAATLYYLKHTGSLWMTANTFGIHQCTVTKIITQVCHAINTVLGPTYLHLPRDVNEMREKHRNLNFKGMAIYFFLAYP